MACKHQSGVRIREVECVREAQIPGEDDTLIEDSQCTETRPGSKELCQSREKCETRARRNIDGIPEKMLRDVWFQTKSELLKNLVRSKRKVVLQTFKRITCEISFTLTIALYCLCLLLDVYQHEIK